MTSASAIMKQFRSLLNILPKGSFTTYKNKPQKITRTGRYIYNNSANTIKSIKSNSAVIVETKKGNDKITTYNGGKKNVYAIYADAGNDTITLNGGDVLVSAGAGKDTVKLLGGKTVVVDGGSGNATI